MSKIVNQKVRYVHAPFLFEYRENRANLYFLKYNIPYEDFRFFRKMGN